MTEKEHLENLAKIIQSFIKKYKFNTYYLAIKGTIDYNCVSSLSISCMSEFDSFTLKQIKNIKFELHEQLRAYLVNHSILKTLIIRSLYNPHGIELIFETSVKIY